MLVLAREAGDLGHLRFGDLIRVHATDSFPFGMYLQHDARGGFTVQREHLLEDLDHELHWSVVVVDEDNPKKRRTLETRLGLLGHQAVVVIPADSVALVRHFREFYRPRRANKMPSASQGLPC